MLQKLARILLYIRGNNNNNSSGFCTNKNNTQKNNNNQKPMQCVNRRSHPSVLLFRTDRQITTTAGVR